MRIVQLGFLIVVVIISHDVKASIANTGVKSYPAESIDLLLNSREVLTNNDNNLRSQILTLDDLSLTHLQNAIISYDPNQKSLYAYYPTIGYLERYFGFDSTLTFERLDTLYFQGEQLNVHMYIKSEEQRLILWEAAIGQVFEYKLTSKEIFRVDDSRVRDFMFGSGSVYVDSLGIYAFGGYGLWEHKNILLRYDFSFREWTKSPEYGQIPYKSSRNYMWYMSEENKLVYLNDGRVSGRVRENGYYNYGVFSYDLNDHNWQRLNQFLIPINRNVQWGSYRHNKANSLDYESKWAHVVGRLFMDITTSEFYQIKKSVFPNIMSLTGFFDKNSGKWLFVGRNTMMDARNLWFATTTLNEDMLEKVSVTPWIWYILTEEWLFILLAGLIVFIGFIWLQKLRLKTSINSVADEIQIIQEDNQIIVFKNSRQILLMDEYIQQIWQIILDQKMNDEREMMMVDFDDKLFTVSNSTSYRSKMKVKLFQEINSDINGFVIRAKRSNLDKRYKVVELNLDIIKLG